MSPPPPAIQALLIACCATAAAWDFRYRRIPNWLVLISLLLGLAVNAFLFGPGSPGLLGSLAGLGLAMLIYLPLYLIRAMGAGDVKLMAAIGAMVGAANWLGLFFCTAILGGVLALVLILLRGRSRKSISNVTFMLSELVHFRAPYMSRAELDVKSGKGVSLPHGVTILLGAVVFLLITRR